MNKVLCFGEALIDFLNTGSHSEDELKLNDYCQYPGGAPANAAVAAAKLGASAAFVGQVGEDMFGEFIEQALSKYGVDTQYLIRHPIAKTALAFVQRDANGERRFSFYRQDTADVLYRADQANQGMFLNAKVLHICSNSLTDSHIATTTQQLIDQAKSNNTLISFDINLRHNLWAAGYADKALVRSFVKQADILKFSKEEIEYLTDDTQRYIQQLISGGAKLVVVTNDGSPIHYYSNVICDSTPAPRVDVVDTTAGGDGFSGGLLYLISQIEELEPVLANPEQIKKVIDFAAHCGAHAVTRPGAFPALPLFSDVEHAVPSFIKTYTK